MNGSSKSTALFALPCEPGRVCRDWCASRHHLRAAAIWPLSLAAAQRSRNGRLPVLIHPANSYPWAGGKGISAIAFVDTALEPDMGATVASNAALLKGLGFPIQR